MFSECALALISFIVLVISIIFRRVMRTGTTIGGTMNSDGPMVKDVEITLIKEIDAIVKKSPRIVYWHDIDFQHPYVPCRQLYKTNCHIGQRKLLLNEIQFFTQSLSLGSAANDIVIYVGAAPCEHLPVIMELFPTIQKFLLIDPNYCIIDAPVKYIYQNSSVISKNAHNIIKTYERGVGHQRRAVAALKNTTYLDGVVRNVLTADETESTKWFDGVTDLYRLISDDTGKIFIIQDYMTIGLAKQLMAKQLGKFNSLFISDLRTNLFAEGPMDMDIIFNDCLQVAILDILRPEYSMLKFHPPYFADSYKANVAEQAKKRDPMIFEPIDYCGKLCGKDIIAEYEAGRYWNYYSNKIFLQPWAPVSSTEARLIVSRDAINDRKFHMYDYKEWEDKYFMLRYVRMYSNYDDGNIPPDCWDGCFDCFIEMTILSEYVASSDKLKLAYDLVEMYKLINESLRYDLHKNLNSKCGLHGSMKAHDINYYYLPTDDKIKRINITKDGPVTAILDSKSTMTEFKLFDTMGSQYCEKLKPTLLAYYSVLCNKEK